MMFPNPVALPETLDLAPYTDLNGLPSRAFAAAATDPPGLEYDLVSVDNWKSGHYVSYSLTEIQGEKKWVMFNDHDAFPRLKTPFEGHAQVRSALITMET
jgi:hypothetical protein